MKFIVFLLCTFLAVPTLADINRCGNIPDNRSVYTQHYDSSNGHTLLYIDITTNSSSGYTWANVLNDTSKWDAYMPWVYCYVSIGGGTPKPCEAERRGDWAMKSPLPSLKVEFTQKGDNYKGMDRLLLGKHPWDPTRVKAKLSLELLQGVPYLSSLFTQFVVLKVDGQDYGLYTLTEDIRKEMMETHGLNKKSTLYKSNKVTWSLAQDKNVLEVTDPKYNESLFEKNWDVRGAKNHSILLKAYREIFDANIDSRAVMENNFNVQNFAAWLAFVILTGNNDIIFNNYGLYAPEPSAACSFPTPLYMMVWDKDGAWSELDDDIAGIDYPLWEEFSVHYFWQMRLVKRFLKVDSFVDLLVAQLQYQIENVLSESKIKALTDTYKGIIRPILEREPDISHIAWNEDIDGWMDNLDGMRKIPSHHYQRQANLFLRPMPVQAFYKFSADASSLLFFWDNSFMLYNRPFFYELQVSSSNQFSDFLVKETTNNTVLAVPTKLFTASKTYFWRLYIRNQADPSQFMTAYLSMDKEVGPFGYSSFTTPSSLSPLSKAVPQTITNFATLKDNGVELLYATLDNVSPNSTASPCVSDAVVLPADWKFAPNTNTTRLHIASLSLKWGGGNLVLADGARTSSSGILLDGFGEVSQHIVEKAVEGAKAYHANCTGGAINRILLVQTKPTPPTNPPTNNPTNNPTNTPTNIPTNTPTNNPTTATTTTTTTTTNNQVTSSTTSTSPTTPPTLTTGSSTSDPPESPPIDISSSSTYGASPTTAQVSSAITLSFSGFVVFGLCICIIL